MKSIDGAADRAGEDILLLARVVAAVAVDDEDEEDDDDDNVVRFVEEVSRLETRRMFSEKRRGCKPLVLSLSFPLSMFE